MVLFLCHFCTRTDHFYTKQSFNSKNKEQQKRELQNSQLRQYCVVAQKHEYILKCCDVKSPTIMLSCIVCTGKYYSEGLIRSITNTQSYCINYVKLLLKKQVKKNKQNMRSQGGFSPISCYNIRSSARRSLSSSDHLDSDVY